MHSPRAQADKRAYQQAVKHIVESQPNVALRQETVEDLLTRERPATERRSRLQDRVCGVRVRGDAVYLRRPSFSPPARFCRP